MTLTWLLKILALALGGALNLMMLYETAFLVKPVNPAKLAGFAIGSAVSLAAAIFLILNGPNYGAAFFSAVNRSIASGPWGLQGLVLSIPGAD